MATPGINTKVKLDGEKEYRAALAQINAALKELGAEMRGVEQDFSDNADSAEALSATNDVLSRKIETQKEKIATLQEVLQKSGEAYGEADKRTIDWKTTLVNAETELKKMQKALDENNEALEESGEGGGKFSTALGKVKDALSKAKEEGTGAKGVFENLKEAFSGGESASVGLGDAISQVAGKLGINLPDGASKALSSLNGISAGSAAAVAGVAALAAAIVAVEKQLISMTKESAAYAKELKTLSSVTGQSTQEIQELQYASEMIGVSYDRIKDSLKEVTNKMQDAQNGSEDTAAAFEQLGVNIENSDGSLRDANDVFYETIDALGAISNKTERDALAMDLLSESAQELNPLIEQGSQALVAYAQEASDMGYVLSDEAVAALGETSAAFQQMQLAQEAAKNQLSAEFAPYLTEFYRTAQETITSLASAAKDSGLVDLFGSLLELVTALVPLVKLLGDAVSALEPIFSNLAEAISKVNGLLASFSNFSFDNPTAGVANIATSAFQIVGQMAGLNASGTDNFAGGLTWVGENGPELISLPRGSQIATAQASRQAVGGDIYNITIPASDIREFNDIVRIAQNQRRMKRMGVT